MYFRNTKVYFQSTKVYSRSTKVYSPSTKVYFQSTSILSNYTSILSKNKSLLWKYKSILWRKNPKTRLLRVLFDSIDLLALFGVYAGIISCKNVDQNSAGYEFLGFPGELLKHCQSLTGYKAFKQPWCTLNFICLQWKWVYNKHTWATKRTLVTFLIHWLFNRDAYNWDIINPITRGILQTPMQPKQPGFSSFFPWTENGDLVFSHTWT